MDDLKKIINKVIELYNNPRYRSLVILGLYIVFFAFVIGLLRATYKDQPNIEKRKTAIEKYQTVISYRYDAKITIENEFELEGFSGTTNYIIYDNVMYSLENSNLYMVKEEIPELIAVNPFIFDIWKITPQFISTLIRGKDINYKTEFSDKTLLNSYLVPVEEFKKLYNPNVPAMSDEDISIMTYEFDNEIVKVELDLTNYYGLDGASVILTYKK